MDRGTEMRQTNKSSSTLISSEMHEINLNHFKRNIYNLFERSSLFTVIETQIMKIVSRRIVFILGKVDISEKQ